MNESKDEISWGYEHSYQQEAEEIAAALFDRWNLELQPRVLLLAFPPEPILGKERVIIFPELYGYEPAMFELIHERSSELAESDSEREVFNVAHNELVARSLNLARKRRIQSRAWKQVVEDVLDEHGTSSYKSFAGAPVGHLGFRYMLVLQLRREPFEQSQELVHNSYFQISDIHSRVPRSLVEAGITVFLSECSRGIRQVNQLTEISPTLIGTKQLARRSAKSLMESRLNRTDYRNSKVFEAFDQLSKARYEGASLTGKVILTGRDTSALNVVVEFREAVSVGDVGAARKVLEMASQGLSVICSCGRFVGLGRFREQPPKDSEELYYTITFDAPGKWQFSHLEKPLFRIQNGWSELIKPKLDLKLFRSTIRRVFGRTSPDIDCLTEIARGAVAQAHGTLLVISDHASEEAARLEKEATAIDELELNEDLTHTLTAIDGAVIVDPTGVCHAIGAILDGRSAPETGDPSRGSRYNSACRYVLSASKEGHQCMALIVSEDGPVDIRPNLPPQIARAELESRFGELEKLSSDPPRWRHELVAEVARLANWFEQHEQYLTHEEADRVNRLRSEAMPAQEPGELRFERHKLEGVEKVTQDLFFSEAKSTVES